MTHQQLLDTMTAAEFTQWLAVQSVDPLFDPWIANALTCRTIASGLGGKSMTLQQFLPYELPSKKSSQIELKAYMKSRVKNGPDQIT